MKTTTITLAAVAAATFCAFVRVAAAESSGFADEIATLQLEFDQASFGALGESERRAAFEALVEHAADLNGRYPDRAEAVAWHGIVLSSYAGEVSALGAMKYARAAREALHKAESLDPSALDGGVYASLGALYSKVPGGIVGFGDDDLAAEYFVKAIAVDPENIDSNYFYGEFLLGQEDYTSAIRVLRRALDAPSVETRPLFDAGRRAEARALLETAEREAADGS